MVDYEQIFGKGATEATALTAISVFQTAMDEAGLADSPILKRVQDGMTLGQAMGLTRDDLDVMYAVGFQKLNAQDFRAAQDVFDYLTLIDPLHAPNYYCLGVVRQGQGKWPEAKQAFVAFLALDATNPVGYLRLGECAQALGDVELAAESFRLAVAECRNGHGDAVTLDEARAKLALMNKGAGA